MSNGEFVYWESSTLVHNKLAIISDLGFIMGLKLLGCGNMIFGNEMAQT